MNDLKSLLNKEKMISKDAKVSIKKKATNIKEYKNIEDGTLMSILPPLDRA